MGPPPRILLVDDEPSILAAAARAITRSFPGADVKHAASPAAAIEWIDKQPFDAIVSDLRMPGGSGLSVLAHAHAKQPSAVRILITAYLPADDADGAIAAAAIDRVLEKPVYMRDYVAVLAKALGARARLPAPPA